MGHLKVIQDIIFIIYTEILPSEEVGCKCSHEEPEKDKNKLGLSCAKFR
jgi:hypothetical protein